MPYRSEECVWDGADSAMSAAFLDNAGGGRRPNAAASSRRLAAWRAPFGEGLSVRRHGLLHPRVQFLRAAIAGRMRGESGRLPAAAGRGHVLPERDAGAWIEAGLCHRVAAKTVCLTLVGPAAGQQQPMLGADASVKTANHSLAVVANR